MLRSIMKSGEPAYIKTGKHLSITKITMVSSL